MTKYIFITGGVISGIGKGITTASIGAILQGYGYNKIMLKKLDPYLNYDPGTMNPFQHGEVFVTDDGTETDLDIGHYERFTNIDANKNNNITSGRLLTEIINKERKGDYLGSTVQIIPHLTDQITKFITENEDNYEFILCEIGGSIGDIEGMAFFEAIRQLRNKRGSQNTLFVHLTYIPYIKATGELKTKPHQNAIKSLMSAGIQPNIIICRSEYKIGNVKKKLADSSNLDETCIIEALDVDNIYQIPLDFSNQNIGNIIRNHFKINDSRVLDLSKWIDLCNTVNTLNRKVNIGIVGKYVPFTDAYKSLTEAIMHSCIKLNCYPNIIWINSRDSFPSVDELDKLNGIIVPGGFGVEGIETKIKSIQYCRENKIPFLGICLGMQLAVIEFARNVLNLNVTSSEFDNCSENNIIGLITEWEKDGNIIKRNNDCDKGGTLRLGSYDTIITKDSLAYELYNCKIRIQERHRHRYEVNFKYIKDLMEAGFKMSGVSPDGKLPEILELDKSIHPFFIVCQFHPEYKSRIFNPRPLFTGFISAVMHLR